MTERSECVVRNFPVLEWSSLSKGMTLDAVTCATAMGVSVSRWREDRILLLKLQRAIRGHRPDLAAHVTSKGDTVVILDDVGAEKHTFDEGIRGLRLITTNTARRAAIDCTDFTLDQKRSAESRSMAMGRAVIEASRALAGEKRIGGDAKDPPELPESTDEEGDTE